MSTEETTVPCGERWRDEIGCVDRREHECSVSKAGHRTHKCYWCDAMVIEDRAVPSA